MLRETQKPYDLQHSLKSFNSYSTLYLMIFNKSTKGHPPSLLKKKHLDL